MRNNSNDKNPFNIASIINDKYYINWIEHLKIKVLNTSRQEDLYNDPFNILFLQFKIVELITNIEKAIKECKEKNKKGRKYEFSLFLHQQLLRITKSIADGLSWRVLGFDRPFLRIMAEAKRYPSSVQFSSHSYKKTQLKAFELALFNNSKVLLNDITNFLRFGDLIEIIEKEVKIHELKKSGKKIINLKKINEQLLNNPKAKISNQIKKLVAAQRARDKRVLISNREFRIIDLDIKFKNNLKDVESLINDTEKNLFSTKVFGNYLKVSCLNNSKLIKDKKRFDEIIENDVKNILEFEKKDIIIPISNIDTFYEGNGDFAKNATPYSIFPFKTDICMGLLSGKYNLMSFINYSEIRRLFIKDGWEIIDHDLNQLLVDNEKIKQNLFTGELFQHRINESFFSIKKGNFIAEIPIIWIQRIGTDFLKPQLLIDMYNFIYSRGKPDFQTLCVFFILDEKKVWV